MFEPSICERRRASPKLTALDGRAVSAAVKQAAVLVATVVGQDLEARDDGTIVIARRVARGAWRLISVVDPEARHGHKTAARGFDGYKGDIAIDPDSEIIPAVDVTAGNVGDGTVAKVLLADVLRAPRCSTPRSHLPTGASRPLVMRRTARRMSSGRWSKRESSRT